MSQQDNDLDFEQEQKKFMEAWRQRVNANFPDMSSTYTQEDIEGRILEDVQNALNKLPDAGLSVVEIQPPPTGVAGVIAVFMIKRVGDSETTPGVRLFVYNNYPPRIHMRTIQPSKNAEFWYEYPDNDRSRDSLPYGRLERSFAHTAKRLYENLQARKAA